MSQVVQKGRPLYERYPYPRVPANFDEYRDGKVIPLKAPDHYFDLLLAAHALP